MMIDGTLASKGSNVILDDVKEYDGLIEAKKLVIS